jgi:hypothetical protein
MTAGRKNPLRGPDAMRKICKKLDLKEPELIKSSNLRKYVATVSQIVDMNESEMGWLANHLGHDIHVHKQFYRLPQSTIEMAVVGNLLMAVDEARAHLFKGKNPRDIQLEGKKITIQFFMKKVSYLSYMKQISHGCMHACMYELVEVGHITGFKIITR